MCEAYHTSAYMEFTSTRINTNRASPGLPCNFPQAKLEQCLSANRIGCIDGLFVEGTSFIATHIPPLLIAFRIRFSIPGHQRHRCFAFPQLQWFRSSAGMTALIPLKVQQSTRACHCRNRTMHEALISGSSLGHALMMTSSSIVTLSSIFVTSANSTGKF